MVAIARSRDSYFCERCPDSCHLTVPCPSLRFLNTFVLLIPGPITGCNVPGASILGCLDIIYLSLGNSPVFVKSIQKNRAPVSHGL